VSEGGEVLDDAANHEPPTRDGAGEPTVRLWVAGSLELCNGRLSPCLELARLAQGAVGGHHADALPRAVRKLLCGELAELAWFPHRDEGRRGVDRDLAIGTQVELHPVVFHGAIVPDKRLWTAWHPLVMGTELRCDRCGFQWDTGAVLENVTIVGGVAADCPWCGHVVKAGDGTYSTSGGRLVKVAEYLAAADREELARLRSELDQIHMERDDARAEAVLARIGALPSEKDRQSDRMELYAILGLILQVVILLLSLGGQRSTTEIVNIIEQKQVNMTRPTPAHGSDAQPARNRLCPCGSGRKFKRCHGAGR
jgi:hypothetical protein